MKRAVAIGITTLFLLQVFTGIRLTDDKDEREEIAVHGKEEGSEGRVGGRTRGGGKASLYENGSLGGSWMDEFEDNSSIEWSKNVSVEDGKVKLNAWKYRRAINMSNTGGELTDYPIQVNLTMENFDYSKARSGAEDIRFADQNDTPLNYWIEYWNNESKRSKIWVNVSNIPNGNSNILMYYGNPSAGRKSNGMATFGFFDDFEEILTWNFERTMTYGSATATLSMDQNYTGLNSVKISGGLNNGYERLTKSIDVSNIDSFIYRFRNGQNFTSCQAYFAYWIDNSLTTLGQLSTYPPSTWFSQEFDVSSLDGIVPFSIGISSNTGIFTYVYFYFDTVIGRKYVSPEPTISLGAEQQPPITSYITSIPITLPGSMYWSTLSFTKTEPANTHINISVINASSNQTIPGFDNLTSRNIDISNITANSIRLRAWFQGDGQNTPTLDSWGVEWKANNTWRDGFVGNSKCAYPVGVDEHTVGYWKFDEGCGNVVRDLSGNGNDGTLKNMNNNDWVEGRFGKGLEFDGKDDVIRINNGLITSGYCSVEGWFKVNDLTTNRNLINQGTSSTTKQGLFIYSVDKKIHFFMDGGSTQTISTSNIQLNKWYHVVGTYDGTIQRLYINGILEDYDSVTADYTAVDRVRIGMNSQEVGSYYFKGLIDEVRISDIARSPSEIRRAYQAGIALRNGSAQLSENRVLAEQNTSALWHFDEGEGGTAYDSTSNDNDGTIHGAEWVGGVHGGALEFDGSDDYVNCGNSLSLNFGRRNFSIEAWVKTNELGSKWHWIFDKGHGNNNERFVGGISSQNKWRFHVGDLEVDAINTPILIGKYYHYAGIRSGDNISLYINGKLAGTTSGAKSKEITNPNPLIIASRDDFSASFWNGTIDSVAIYDRALNASEIFNHSRRYHTNATLQSTPISLPPYHSWDTLLINKTESKNHFVNVSIIDNSTNKTIKNFENINSSGAIDISSIDINARPVIRLNATFEGNGTNTSLLHSWGVNWTNRLPRLGQPTGLAPVNRTEPINVSIPASDFEENLTALNFTFKIKHHSDAEWYSPETASIARNLTHVFINDTIPADADIGPHDIRFRLNDSLNATTGWVYPNGSLLIKNNHAVFDGLELSADEVFRTDNITVTLLNISDIETDFGSLNITLQHRSHGTQTWYEDYTSTARNRGDEFTFVFEPSKDATLGSYDLKVEIDDDDNITEFISPDRVFVKNNLPKINGIFPVPSEVYRTTGTKIDIFGITDPETELQQMAVNLYYRPNGTVDWGDDYLESENETARNKTYNFTPPVGAVLGKYDLKAEIDDGDDLSVFHSYNALTVVNNPPVISGNLSYLWLYENTESRFSLKGYGEDVEDGGDELNWSVNSSTVNASLFENVTVQNSVLSIVPNSDVNGTDSVEIILADEDGATVRKDITVEIIPLEMALAAKLDKPANRTSTTKTDITLEWTPIVADTNATVVFDIYLSTKLANILTFNQSALEGNTTATHYDPADLSHGEKYYWTVIPRNNTSVGVSVPSFRWFEILPEFNYPPETELLEPANGIVINATAVDLIWSGSDLNDDELTYFVYLSGSLSDVRSRILAAKIATVGKTAHPVFDLEKNKKYYWTAIPFDGEVEGNCTSGVWSFTVGGDPIEPPEVSLAVNSKKAFIGEKLTFNVGSTSTRKEVLYRIEFGDGTLSTWEKQTTFTHTYADPGDYVVTLKAKVDGVKVPVPGSVKVSVRDPAEIGLMVIKPVDTGKETITFTGSLVGTNFVSANISIEVTVNEHVMNVEPELSWSLEIPREYFNDGNNTITVKVYFKDGEIDSENKTFFVSVGAEKPVEGVSPVLWAGAFILILIIAVVLFFLFKRRKEEAFVPEDEIEEEAEEGIDLEEETDIEELEPEEPEEPEIPPEPSLEPETTPVIPEIGPSSGKVPCKVCFGDIKTGAPVLTCECGKHFHIECIKRVGECPACDSPMELPEEIPTTPEVEEPQLPPEPPEPKKALPEEPEKEQLPLGSPPRPAVISAAPADEEHPTEASMVILDESVTCRICYGVIKTGLEVIQCRCGKVYHASCGIRVGECPSCSYEYQKFIDEVEEEILVENVKDSVEGGMKEVEGKVEESKEDDYLHVLKKRLVNGEISIEEYREMKEEVTEG